MRHYKASSLFVILILLMVSRVFAANHVVTSPNERIKVIIQTAQTMSYQQPITYSVLVNGHPLIKNAQIGLKKSHQGQATDKTFQLVKEARARVERAVKPVVREKAAQIKEHYNQLSLSFSNNQNLVFRVFDQGVGYRFEFMSETNVIVEDELSQFNFNDNYLVYFPEEKSFVSHNERSYLEKSLSSIKGAQFASLPLLVDTKVAKLVISETDLYNYPGMWLSGEAKPSLSAIFPRQVLESELKKGSDRNENIIKRSANLAEIEISSPTNVTLPWRIIAVAEDDASLLTNQLSYLLARESKLEQTDWIKPGKVAWDWWNANNIYGVDFKAGINTNTYKYYIDFAAKYGLEYIVLDEGWYHLGNVLDVVDEINVQEIINYGKSKNVDVILWVIWETLDQQLDLALDTYQKWGAAGIKVDFMQRDDQQMVNYYWKVAEAAAKRQLLVNFHGSYKPAGLRRAYPNVITREGVRGLEHNKWGDYITSEHNLTLPFIRMVAGPMDYTPGAMVNTQPENFAITFNRPMSKTTRAHQVAMYVIYESPLQMLADSPSNYFKEHESTTFIARIPTVWDETKILSAKIKDHIISARRNKQNWFIGAMTNRQARQMEIELSFLPDGQYRLVSFNDGVNAERYASDYLIEERVVSNQDKVTFRTAPNGGWAGYLQPIH